MQQTPGPRMSSWMNFLESLSSQGGAIFLLIFLMILGVVFTIASHAFGGLMTIGEKIAGESFIALLAILGAKRMNSNPPPPPAPAT